MEVSKTKSSFYRRLYVAWLIDSQTATSVPALMEATGMPRRTAQDTIAALADLDIVHPCAHGVHHARELMPHGDGCGLARDGMRVAAGRDEDRPFHELMQIRAADAAPGHLDAHGAGLHHGFGDVLDADVAPVVETCCFHDSTSPAALR